MTKELPQHRGSRRQLELGRHALSGSHLQVDTGSAIVCIATFLLSPLGDGTCMEREDERDVPDLNKAMC
jgi:hypothetical protein